MRLIRIVISRVLPFPVKNLIRRYLKILRAASSRIKAVINVKPLSENNGSDRDLTINRYYLEQFLKEFSSDIGGHCLEFQKEYYDQKFAAIVYARAIKEKEMDKDAPGEDIGSSLSPKRKEHN
jgi:hypothetical protein